MPPGFEDCFRNGDVGGERGFDAALAFLIFEAAESALDGDMMKVTKPISSKALKRSTNELCRRTVRMNPIVVARNTVL